MQWLRIGRNGEVPVLYERTYAIILTAVPVHPPAPQDRTLIHQYQFTYGLRRLLPDLLLVTWGQSRIYTQTTMTGATGQLNYYL